MQFTMECERGALRVSLQGSASARVEPAGTWRHTPQSGRTAWHASAYRENGSWVAVSTVERRTGSRRASVTKRVKDAIHHDVMTALNSLRRETLVEAERRRLRAELDLIPKEMEAAQAAYLSAQTKLSRTQRELRQVEMAGCAGDKALRGD